MIKTIKPSHRDKIRTEKMRVSAEKKMFSSVRKDSHSVRGLHGNKLNFYKNSSDSEIIVADCVHFHPGNNISLMCWVRNSWGTLYQHKTRHLEPCTRRNTLPTLCQRALTNRQTDMGQDLFTEYNQKKNQQDYGSFDLYQ